MSSPTSRAELGLRGRKLELDSEIELDQKIMPVLMKGLILTHKSPCPEIREKGLEAAPAIVASKLAREPR